MRILKSLITVLIIGLILAGAVGCRNSSPTPTKAATKQVKVAMGNISNAVTGTATLGLAKTQDLTFEMAGYVDQILVKESDTVTKGQQLAILDTTDWKANIKTLESSLSTAQRTLNDRNFALTKAKRVIDTRTLAKKQADLNLRTAQQTLADIDDVKQVQTVLDTINNDIAFAQTSQRAALALKDTNLAFNWANQIKFLNENLEAASIRMNKVLKGTGVSSDKVALQIAQDVLAAEQAQKAVDDAQIAIDDAQRDVDNAQLDVNNAQSNVTDAQSKLDDTKALSPIVTAPFDGFITSIKATGGAEVFKGSVAMQIADPNQFQASFMVSETDIFSIKVGQAASVSVDALSSQSFPAKVTAIAPLATTNSGVVNYKVTAEITSLTPSTPNFALFSGSVPGGFSGGTIPTGARSSGFPTGQRPSGMPSGSLPAGFGNGNSGNPTTGPRGVAPSPVAAAPVTLKQGLSASVTITIQEKRNVLTAPLRAITTVGGKSTAQVVEGTLTRPVEVITGLSDDSNIEIVSGLTEGQTVIVKASGSTGSNSFGPPGGVIIR